MWLRLIYWDGESNTQGNIELPWRLWFSTQEYPLPWRSMSAAKETTLFLAVLFWSSKKSLALKVIQDCGSDSAYKTGVMLCGLPRKKHYTKLVFKSSRCGHQHITFM